MARSVHSEGAAKPVLIAIVVTVAACGLCMAAYIKLIVEPKFRAMSDRAQSTRAEAAPSDRAASEVRQSRQRRRNIARTAALIRGLAEKRDAMRASTAEPEAADEGVRPSDEEIRANRQAEMAMLEKELASEPVDADWANEIEKVTEDAVAVLDANLELEEVTCRKTFCHARLTHRDPVTHAWQHHVEEEQRRPSAFGTSEMRPYFRDAVLSLEFRHFFYCGEA
jgi:hypothetical protein